MSELLEQLRQSFADEEYRNAYTESFMNSYVAAQIKTLREEFSLTQDELAERIGTKQPGIARLENVNYSSWKVDTLRKLARAFHVRLKVTFEEFGTLAHDIENFNRHALLRAPFESDPVFSLQRTTVGRHRRARRARRRAVRYTTSGATNAAILSSRFPAGATRAQLPEFEGASGSSPATSSLAAREPGVFVSNVQPFSSRNGGGDPAENIAQWTLRRI